jgi:hypothetical protein
MKKLVISYSLTGNNNALASAIAGALSAEHHQISLPESRGMGQIALDMIFNRTPRVEMPPLPEEPTNIILAGPVWMGSAASPLRACLKILRKRRDLVSFVTISGGADHHNPKLTRDLTHRLGRHFEKIIDFYIADLLPADPKPTRDDTSVYKLSPEEVTMLSYRAVKALTEEALNREV